MRDTADYELQLIVHGKSLPQRPNEIEQHYGKGGVNFQQDSGTKHYFPDRFNVEDDGTLTFQRDIRHVDTGEVIGVWEVHLQPKCYNFYEVQAYDPDAYVDDAHTERGKAYDQRARDEINE